MISNAYRTAYHGCNGVLFMIALTVFFSVTTAFAQPKVFTENLSFYENGKPKEISLKDADLNMIGYRVLNPVGTVLFQLLANPEKGTVDVIKGPMKAVVGKGLTCTSCEWTPDIPESDYEDFLTSLNGKFNEGRPVGPVKVFRVSEPYRSTAAPAAEAWIGELKKKMRLQFSSFLAPSRYERELKMTLNYNQKGNLEGAQKINPLTSLYFKDGILMGFTVRNESNPAIVKDSVFREGKIWKINNRYQRNTAILQKLEWNEFNKPWEFSFEPFNYSGQMEYVESSYGDFVFFGSEVSILQEGFSDESFSVGYVYGGNWKYQNYIQFKVYAEKTKGRWHYKSSEDAYVYQGDEYYDGQGYDDDAGPIVRLTALLTSSNAERAFPLPTSDARSPYSLLVNEALKDLGYYEFVRKKQAGVPMAGEYPAHLIYLFDRVCSESPLAFDPECSNGVYVWDYISWLAEFFKSGDIPLRGLYLITEEGEFINYATPENARKFVELANSRR